MKMHFNILKVEDTSRIDQTNARSSLMTTFSNSLHC